jgi:hypothetical protein
MTGRGVASEALCGAGAAGASCAQQPKVNEANKLAVATSRTVEVKHADRITLLRSLPVKNQIDDGVATKTVLKPTA